MVCCLIIEGFFPVSYLISRCWHNKSLTWGGYRILEKGVRDMHRQRCSPVGVCGGGGRASRGKIEVVRNGISIIQKVS